MLLRAQKSLSALVGDSINTLDLDHYDDIFLVIMNSGTNFHL